VCVSASVSLSLSLSLSLLLSPLSSHFLSSSVFLPFPIFLCLSFFSCLSHHLSSSSPSPASFLPLPSGVTLGPSWNLGDFLSAPASPPRCRAISDPFASPTPGTESFPGPRGRQECGEESREVPGDQAGRTPPHPPDFSSSSLWCEPHTTSYSLPLLRL
jgi:hypothetical protein